MLDLIIPARKSWDDDTETFIKNEEIHLKLEHSLISVSKWESKYQKPFLENKERTLDELKYYVKCMTITPNVPDSVFDLLSDKEFETINEYINNKFSATWFNDKQSRGRSGGTSEAVTSELIYYWMIHHGIDMSCEKWNINRLITLIRICSIKNNGGNNKKMSEQEILQQNAALNAARRKKYNP